MISWLLMVLRAVTGIARSRASLAAENALLHHQLTVLQRERPRPLLRPADRVLWIWLSRHWSRWRSALVLVQPATVLKWHREGYRRYWRRRSGGLGGRPRIPRSHISLIRRISSDHPEWGEDRIALELKAKLGVEHAPSTIRRYMVARCSAAFTTITDLPLSSGKPANLVAGRTEAGRSRSRPQRRTLFSTECGVSIAAPKNPPVVKCKNMLLAVGYSEGPEILADEVFPEHGIANGR